MNLEGRVAACQCGRTKPSNESLAFFEYRGEGSRVALERCGTCSYTEVAHKRALEPGNDHIKHITAHDFTPIGALETDIFYCGCRGWD